MQTIKKSVVFFYLCLELENSLQLEESKISSLEKEITNISNKYEELKT